MRFFREVLPPTSARFVNAGTSDVWIACDHVDVVEIATRPATEEAPERFDVMVHLNAPEAGRTSSGPSGWLPFCIGSWWQRERALELVTAIIEELR